MKTKETVHKGKPGTAYLAALCGRGVGKKTSRAASVTCGRCLMLMKFAQKRATEAVASKRRAS